MCDLLSSSLIQHSFPCPTLSVNSLKGPHVKSEVIKFPLAVTTPLVSGMSFFMQGEGGDSRGWAEWPLASGGRQARDEELPEISEQPELAGTCPLLHTLPYGAMPTIHFSEGPRGSQASQAMPVNPRNKCGLVVESAGVAGQEGSRSFPGAQLFSSLRVIM